MRSTIRIIFVGLFISLFLPYVLFSQKVTVNGKLEVVSMDTLNAEELLVVRKGDGTLGTRQVSSLPVPTDTTRTLATDMALAQLLCDCGNNMPPFLIESSLNAGYTVADLLNAGVPISNLITGGAPLQDFLNMGVTPAELLAEGAPLEDFHGLEYAGGLIFYINGAGSGYVCASNDLSNASQWGCEFQDLTNVPNVTMSPPSGPGADIGDGLSNTNNFVMNSCILPTDAAFICYNLIEDGYDDWVLPSILELQAMYNNLHLKGLGNFSTDTYSSSTERSTNVAWALEFSTGVLSDLYSKTFNLSVRPIRAF